MKKNLFAFAAMFFLAACGNKQAVVPAEGDKASNEVAFEVAKNYFFKNDQKIPSSPKITTAEEFGKLFGMATTMGENGKPTPIDFTKKFVLAIVQPRKSLQTDLKRRATRFSTSMIPKWAKHNHTAHNPYRSSSLTRSMSTSRL